MVKPNTSDAIPALCVRKKDVRAGTKIPANVGLLNCSECRAVVIASPETRRHVRAGDMRALCYSCHEPGAKPVIYAMTPGQLGELAEYEASGDPA